MLQSMLMHASISVAAFVRPSLWVVMVSGWPHACHSFIYPMGKLVWCTSVWLEAELTDESRLKRAAEAEAVKKVADEVAGTGPGGGN
jgi:hypothetical protein